MHAKNTKRSVSADNSAPALALVLPYQVDEHI